MTAKKHDGKNVGPAADDNGREERMASLAAMWRAHTRSLDEAAQAAQSGEEPSVDPRAIDPPPFQPAEPAPADTPADDPGAAQKSGDEVDPPPEAEADAPVAFAFGPTREEPQLEQATPARAETGDWFSEGGAFPGLPDFMQSGPDAGDSGRGRALVALGRQPQQRRARAPIALIATVALVASAAVAGAAYVGDLGFVTGLVHRNNLPQVAVRDARGTEDGVVPLAVTVDAAPGTELSQIVIAGVPDGARLSAGTEGAPGRWILMPPANDEQYLENLTLEPVENFNGAISLTVTAVARDGDELVESSVSLDVIIDAVADAPRLRVADAAGSEDAAVTLEISAAVGDPQEQLVVTIADVPDGVSLSQGENTDNGVWVVPAAALADLTLTPAVNFKGAFTLRVTAEASDHDDQAALSRTMDISIQPIADPPTLQVTTGPAREDTPVSLTIDAQLTDASETLSVRVSGLPDDATLSAGERQPDGGWILAADDIAELAINPPPNFNGGMSFTVAATARDGSDLTTETLERTVDIAPVADRPNLSVTSVTGAEDETIALGIEASPTVPGEEVLVRVANLPAGARLSAGTVEEDGQWSVDANELDGLSLTPPENFSGLIALTVTAESADGPVSVARSARLGVAVTPVADAPELTLTDVDGLEDTAIGLGIQIAATDASETIEVRIEGVPAGATLTAGSIDDAGAWIVPLAAVGGLALVPATNFSGALSLPVVATSQDGADRAVQRGTLQVAVVPVADTPVVTTTDVSGVEDHLHALGISAALADGAEELQVVLTGIPAGAELSAGERATDGGWVVPAEALSGLELMPPEHFNGDFDIVVTALSRHGDDTAATQKSFHVATAPVADPPALTVANGSGSEDSAIALTIEVDVVSASETATVFVENMPAGAALSAGRDNGDGRWVLTSGELADLRLIPPENFNGDIALNVIAETRDGADRAAVAAGLAINVAAVADVPVLAVQNVAGPEDSVVPLAINPTPGNESEVLSISVIGLPAGAFLSAGEDAGDGRWLLSMADLAGLALTPPRDFHGPLPLYVTATATDGASSTTVGRSMLAAISSIVDQPRLIVQRASGTEDSPVALAIDAVAHDAEEALQVTVSGVPAGGRLSAGTEDDDGNWVLAASDLVGLELVPPPDYSGAVALDVVAVARAGGGRAEAQAVLGVDIAAVADAPELSVNAARGAEDSAIPLEIRAAVTDVSELLAVAVVGLPSGTTLSAGQDAGDGRWLLSADELGDVTLTAPADFSGSLALKVSAVTQDGDNQAVTTVDLDVVVDAVADVPRMIVSSARGTEDTPIPLAIASGTTDPSEDLVVTLSDVPAGGSLSAGRVLGDATWRVAAQDLPTLALIPPVNFSGSFTLTATATSQDGEDSASISDTIDVFVAPVADTPALTAVDAAGDEDNVVALLIDAGVADPSEELTVRITGLPDGASLSAGTADTGASDGGWTLALADLAALSLTPPPHFAGVLLLRAVAQSHDGAETAEIVRAFQVAVAALADAPRLAVAAVDGIEDQPTPLIIDAAVVDPSETLTVLVSELPDGVTLSAGALDDDGRYLLSAADLSDLWLTPPEDFSGQFELTVAATSTDGDDAATADAKVIVSVAGVADTATVSAADAVGEEDVPVVLGLTVTLEDASEQASVSVEGVPPDAALSAGAVGEDGRWQLAVSDLDGLTFTPEADFSGEVVLNIAVTTRDGDDSRETLAALAMTIEPRADIPTLEISDALGIEDGVITLDISAAVSDASETLSIVIDGLPSGGTLTAGTVDDAGAWSLAAADLPGLALRLPENFNGSFALDAVATATDGGDTATRDVPVNVIVAPVADPPSLAVGSVAGATGETIDVPMILTSDAEHASAVVSGLAPGATLNNGAAEADGTWRLDDGDLTDLALIPAAGYRGSFRLVFAIAAIDGNDRQEVEEFLDVIIGEAVADEVAVLLSAGPPVEPAVTLKVETADPAPVYTEPQVDVVAAVELPVAPPPAPVSRLRSLSDSNLADLTQRGESMLQVGDIFAARLLFELAANEGFTAAVVGLGKTYDPLYFEEASVVGAAADAEKALRWYGSAANAGDADATQRLERLRGWLATNRTPGSIGPAG